MKCKQKAYNERVAYIKSMSLLYDVFRNEDVISLNENDVFEYIQELPMETINNMFETLIMKSTKLDIMECYMKPPLFKFIVIQFIQELRQIEG